MVPANADLPLVIPAKRRLVMLGTNTSDQLVIKALMQRQQDWECQSMADLDDFWQMLDEAEVDAVVLTSDDYLGPIQQRARLLGSARLAILQDPEAEAVAVNARLTRLQRPLQVKAFLDWLVG